MALTPAINSGITAATLASNKDNFLFIFLFYNLLFNTENSPLQHRVLLKIGFFSKKYVNYGPPLPTNGRWLMAKSPVLDSEEPPFTSANLN